MDHRLSGACGAQDCQALTTRLARDHGQVRKNRARVRRLWVVNVIEVATPKLPPPPPRLAQYRSLWLPELEVTVLPSARTTSSDRRLSLVRP